MRIASRPTPSEVCETFVDGVYTIQVAQKQGDNYFVRDPGDDDL